MPELPDVELYLHALRARIVGRRIHAVRVGNPFIIRSTAPDPQMLTGRTVLAVSRLGKRVVFEVEDLFVVVHLMIAGRFQWKAAGAPIPKKLGMLAIDFEHGSLLLTEAGSTRRASVRLVADRHMLHELDPGGLEVLESSFEAFREVLARERHTLKRSLTDPTLFSGIGNAYSDEILHRAGLSPVRMSDALTPDEVVRLHRATITVLPEWRDRLIAEAGDSFPVKVTAFHDGMAVHGRYGQPCPVCATPVQRLRYATNEANYCPTCQTGGRLLADRGLSRLLKGDWPASLDELQRRKAEYRLPEPRGVGDADQKR